MMVLEYLHLIQSLNTYPGIDTRCVFDIDSNGGLYPSTRVPGAILGSWAGRGCRAQQIMRMLAMRGQMAIVCHYYYLVQ